MSNSTLSMSNRRSYSVTSWPEKRLPVEAWLKWCSPCFHPTHTHTYTHISMWDNLAIRDTANHGGGLFACMIATVQDGLESDSPAWRTGTSSWLNGKGRARTYFRIGCCYWCGRHLAGGNRKRSCTPWPSDFCMIWGPKPCLIPNGTPPPGGDKTIITRVGEVSN